MALWLANVWPCGVLYTAKAAAAERDPRRFHVFPPSAISGATEADGEALSKAYAYLENHHAAPCDLKSSSLVVQRVPVLGIANDLNYIVRAFALSLRQHSGGQLLLLPPAQAPAHKGKGNNRESIAKGRTIDTAWHWFDGLPGARLDSIFTPSSCQTLLQSPAEIGRLRALDAASRNESLASAAAALGFGGAVFDASKAVKALGTGFRVLDVPKQFKDYGMLWWWQVLTTYLVRVRGPLAARLQQHPALEAMRAQLASAANSPTTATQRQWLDASQAALLRAVGRGPNREPGWMPAAAFDAALHVRMGDACGPRAKRNQEIVRKCVLTLNAGLRPLLAHGVVPAGGHVFLATDSHTIVAEAAAAAASMPFTVHYLGIDRAKYDTEAWIELASAKDHTQLHILEETMLDILLLSRARYIAGSMYGNVPRVALQLRPTTPGDRNRLAYVTTDGRDWCTLPTCMKNNTPTGRYWR